MNSIARSATIVALLGFQKNVLVSEAKIDDYEVLTAVFWDLYPVVRSTDIPLPHSATKALEHCRRFQDELLQTLHSMGLLKSTKIDEGSFDTVSRFIRRFTKKSALQRAETNYRNSVFLLRDITMDAVTHYHLQHMRYELDHICGGWDQAKIDITINKDATIPQLERTKTETGKSVDYSTRNDVGIDHGEWVKVDGNDFWFKGTAYIGDAGIPASHDNLNTDETAEMMTIPVRGIYDTGSDRNIVSSSFLNKHGIFETAVRSMTTPEPVKGVAKTMETKLDRTATLRWSMKGSAPRSDTFYVMDTGEDSYDILLGWPFIQAQEIFAMKKKAPVPTAHPTEVRVRAIGRWPNVQHQIEEKAKTNMDRLAQLAKRDRQNMIEVRKYEDEKGMSVSPSTPGTATTFVGSPDSFDDGGGTAAVPGSSVGLGIQQKPVKRGTWKRGGGSSPSA